MAEKSEKGEKAEKPKKDEGAPKKEGQKPAGDKAAAAKGGGGKGAPGKGGKDDKKGKSDTAPAGEAIKRTQPPRLKTIYDKEVVPRLMKEFGHKNHMEVPKLVKITVNMGLGEAIANPKIIDHAVE
jgi:large subunit ribosomal protein L5